jgi:hypothetical protein
MAKVYVSSTVADLKQERQAVVDWLRAARHQAVDSYLPDSETVRDSCLEDVDACDLYVLILGHRYGFQPPEGNPEGLSITRMEFRRAGQSGLPRIALVRTSIPDVSVSDMADPRRATLVFAFRDEVAREVRTAEFGDLQGLIQGLSTGVQAGLEKLSKRDQPGERQLVALVLREVLHFMERVLGSERRITLFARALLAHWTGLTGDVAGARDQLAVLLPIRERVLGPEHPDTLSARDNLARWTGEAGDAVGARDQLAALLPIQEQVLGPEHPDTVSTRAHLSHWTQTVDRSKH